MHGAAELQGDFEPGLAALRAGRMEECIRRFRDLVRTGRGDPAVLLEKIGSGERGLGMAIERQDRNYEVRIQRGLLRLARGLLVSLEGGDPGEACRGALEDFTAAVDLRPESAGARVCRANVLTFSGRYARHRGRSVASVFQLAVEDLDRACASGGMEMPAYHNRGINHFYLARYAGERGVDVVSCYDKALADLRTAWKLEPEYPYLRKDLGVVTVALAKVRLSRGEKVKDLFEEAAEHLSAAVALDDGLVGAWVERGSVQYSLKRFSGAIEDWERAIELDPARRSLLDPRIGEARERLARGGEAR